MLFTPRHHSLAEEKRYLYPFITLKAQITRKTQYRLERK